MSKETLKNVQAIITKECWMELRIMSVRNEMTLPEVIKDILEKFTAKRMEKSKQIIE